MGDDDAKQICDEEFEWQEALYKRHLQEIDNIDDKRFKLSMDLNKTIIALAGATLTLSMTLVNQTFDTPVGRAYLYLAWLLCGLAIMLVVAGSYLSEQALSKHRGIVIELYNKRVNNYNGCEEIIPQGNPFNPWITYLEFISIATLLGGYFFLGAFVVQNI